MTQDCNTCDAGSGAVTPECPLLNHLYPEGLCEKFGASKHSPGIMFDNETVLRTIYSPIHVEDDNKTVKPAAFEDAISKTGLSLNRCAHISLPDLWKHSLEKYVVDKKAGKEPAPIIQFVGGNVGNIRSMEYDNTTRSFLVYDTAKPDNVAHCDVTRTREHKDGTKFSNKRSHKLKARQQIKSAFGSQALSIEDVAAQYFPNQAFDADDYVVPEVESDQAQMKDQLTIDES